MIEIEKSFPRGGTVKSKPETAEKIIFGAKQIKKKIEKKQQKEDPNDSEHNLEDELEENVQSSSAEILNYETVQEGMIIMGLVKSIDSTSMKVSLPGRMVAKVYASSISESYNNILNNYIQSTDRSENYKLLNEMYTVGQTVYGKIMEIKANGSDVINLILSLKPIDVHSDLIHDNMKKGMTFNGAVEEIQEHGYIIESGIKNLRCFLPLENSQKKHSVGELINLKINKLTQTSAASTAICKEVTDNNCKIKDQIDPKLDYILPGTIVNFSITHILKNGLQGTVMNGKFTGFVNEHQLNEPLAVPQDFNLNSTINAKILYIMPLTKVVNLSLNLSIPNIDPLFKRGDIIEKAVVHHIGTGGVVLVLKNRFKGVLSFKSIKANYTGNYDQDEIRTQFCQRSKHKVRVLGYDMIESIYICSNDPNILNTKIFTVDNLQTGEIVHAKILEKDKNDGYILSVGNVKGRIDPLYLSPASKNLLENTLIRCRVISIDENRKLLNLSNHPEYLSKNCKILMSTNQVKPQSTFLGTVVNCREKFVIVKFFNNLKGILYKKNTNGIMATESLSLFNGLTMQFRIIAIMGEQIIVGFTEDVYKIGEIVSLKVTHILSSGLEMITENGDENQEQLKVIVPYRLLTDYSDLALLKLKIFNVGDKTDACCIAKNIFSLRDVTYFRNASAKPLSKIKIGDVLRSFIKNVQGDIIEILLPIQNFHNLVKIHLNMVLTNSIENPNIVVTPEQVVYVKVLSMDARTKAITVTAKLTDVWNGNLEETANHFSKYLEEMQLIQNGLSVKNHLLGNIKIGEKVTVKIQNSNKETGDWYINLSNGAKGILKSSLNRKRNLKPGEEQKCIVLWIDYLNQLVYVSNRESELNRISESTVLPENLVNVSGINARILLKLDNVIVCTLKKGINPIIFIPTQLHLNDFEKVTSTNLSEGDFIRLTFIHKKHPIAVLEKTYKFWNTINGKEKNNLIKFLRKDEKHEYLNLIGDCKEKKMLSENETVHEQPPNKKRKLEILPGANDFWLTELPNNKRNVEQSSSEDDELDIKSETQTKKKKKLTATDRFRASKEEERRLRQIEENYADPNILPENADQFDRLLISEPNNSKNWINYMVFQLQATEIDKARSIARKGIQTISFREELEIINLWVALLNLELRYGTKENFKETLKEAVSKNDPIEMYLRVFEVLADANKTQELIESINIATKKYKDQLNVWKNAACAFFKVGMTDRGKQMLSKALAVLPERDHVAATVAFANLNHKFNDIETAHSLLEQIIISFPKRVDVWSQYVDMLIKDEQIESARNTLERAVIQKIPLKKMKTLFKKYLDFEEKFGNGDNVQKVKLMAANYVQTEVNT